MQSIGVATFAAKYKLSDGSIRPVKFTNVFLVPEITKNLILVLKITNNGGTVEFGKGVAKISDGAGEAMLGKLNDGLFVVRPIQDEVHLASRAPSDPWLKWHRRSGHLGSRSLQRLVRQDMVTGLKLDSRAESVFL